MKRIRILSLITALMMAVSIVGVNSIEAFAVGGCGNWEICYVGNAYCDASSACGFLWLKDTYNQKKEYVRTCVSASNSIYYEYKDKIEKLGCC